MVIFQFANCFTRGYPIWFSHVGAQGPQGFIHHTVGSGVAQARIEVLWEVWLGSDFLGANMAEDGLRWLKMGELYEYLFNPCHTLSAFESTCFFWEQCSKKCETAPLFDHSIYASHRWEAAPFLGGTSWMDEEHGKKSGNHVYRRGSCLK